MDLLALPVEGNEAYHCCATTVNFGVAPITTIHVCSGSRLDQKHTHEKHTLEIHFTVRCVPIDPCWVDRLCHSRHVKPCGAPVLAGTCSTLKHFHKYYSMANSLSMSPLLRCNNRRVEYQLNSVYLLEQRAWHPSTKTLDGVLRVAGSITNTSLGSNTVLPIIFTNIYIMA